MSSWSSTSCRRPAPDDDTRGTPARRPHRPVEPSRMSSKSGDKNSPSVEALLPWQSPSLPIPDGGATPATQQPQTAELPLSRAARTQRRCSTTQATVRRRSPRSSTVAGSVRPAGRDGHRRHSRIVGRTEPRTNPAVRGDVGGVTVNPVPRGLPTPGESDSRSGRPARHTGEGTFELVQESAGELVGRDVNGRHSALTGPQR